MDIDTALEQLKAIVGPSGSTTDAAEMAPYLVDSRDLYRGATRVILRPSNVGEVAAVVAICAKAGIAIVPQGGNTGHCGGSVPSAKGDEIVLALSRMNRIRDVDTVGHTMVAEAGCILAAVQDAAAEADLLFPLSLGAEGSCQIGGNLSTNAGGVAVLRYGNARDLVLGLEVVLADGRIWHGLRGLRKDNTGYDLKNLFVGAEGTLGIITAATLKLFPRPRGQVTALVAVRDVDAAVDLFLRARERFGHDISAFELLPGIGVESVLEHLPEAVAPLAEKYDWYVLCEVSAFHSEPGLRPSVEEFLETGLDSGWLVNGVIAESGTQAANLWRLREAIPEAQKFAGGSIKHDISVPISRIGAFVRQASDAVASAVPDCRPFIFGHIGDGNVHFNVSQPVGADRDSFLARWPAMNRTIHDIAVSLGGSFSGEHGIGQLKIDDLERHKDAVELDLMRTLKRALDPQGIMNPGKVLRPFI